jgi:hypothetical protein
MPLGFGLALAESCKHDPEGAPYAVECEPEALVWYENTESHRETAVEAKRVRAVGA